MKRLFKKETGIKLALMFIIASMVLVMMPAGMLYADAIGPNSGTSFANIGFGVTWSNTQNAAASDNLYATTPLSKPTGVTVPLSATGFNFNIPAGSTINGIEVMVERSQTTAGRYYDDHLRLIRNGVPSTSAIKYGGNPNVVGFIPLTDATITFGGPTDLWSESWTVDDINNAGFGFYFTARTSYTGSICKVDFMSMTVYYTLPSDTTPPVIDPVADITIEATSSDGAVVDFSTTATDNVDPVVTVNAAPASGSVFPLGTTQVTLNATDAAGNAAIPVIFNVIVQDTTAPVIDPIADIVAEATSLSGAEVSFSPTVTEASDPAVTVNAAPASGSVFPLGTTQVTLNAIDASGNVASPVTFNVIVQDTTAPVITITGANPVDVSYGDIYNEEGAVWLDAVDGSGSAVISGDTVDTNALGAYIIKYNYTDAAGNMAAEAQRTVNVVDITKPVITLNGDALMDIENGETYNELGAIWIDNVDGTGAADISGDTVNTSLLGSYIVRYNYTDTSSNAADEVTRTVNVVDTQVPVITLLGDADVTLEALSVYSDAGATAFDSYDGDLTEDILVVNEVNANVPGDYLVKYNVSDSSGNSAVEVVRTVHIVDSTPPVISILGINPVNIYIGDAYTDAGAEAMDNIDGNITPNITTINNVNNAVAGAYTVEYSVNDTAGNNATATRTVNVENHPPIAVDDSFAYPNNKTITIPVSVLLSNDYDPEGGKVSFVSLSQGTGGVASYSAILKRVIFKPAKGFNGLASFTYTIKDSVGLQSSATVWLSIVINELPDNLPPIAVDDTLSTNKVWTSIPVSKLLSNDSDPEGTTISFVSVSKASNNARLVSGFNQLLLIVKRGYTGTVTFSYVIKDANGLQSTGNVTVDVNNARLF